MASEKNKFQKLTPVHDAKLSIYKDALDFVFENADIKNVAISGAYSAGKSSVIETYEHEKAGTKFLHISLAYFESAASNDEKETPESKNPLVKENVLEGKILNQLIHQIDAAKIPQTNFRVKQCKRQSKVQNFRQFKYKEFGNQSTRFSAIKIQRYRQRVCLLEL